MEPNRVLELDGIILQTTVLTQQRTRAAVTHDENDVVAVVARL